MMFKKAAIVAVALAGQVYVEASAIQKRDGGGHGHSHSHSHAAAAPPSSGYSEPSSGYSAPASSYSAPATSYSAPSTSYSAPASSYGAPSDGYGAPASSYGAPSTGYAEPAPTYAEEAPVYGAEEAGGPGLVPIIVGILALIGLSLLFPTFVDVGRRKRSTAEESNPMQDIAERVNDIYGAVLESEECMEKIACELGGMAKDLTSSPVAGLMEPFIPVKYTGYYKQFKSGKNCHKIKCGTPF